MRSLLVTGGAGFIGSNFVHFWLEKHPQDRVVVLDALTYAGNPANLQSVQQHPSFKFVRGDIREQTLVEDLLDSERIDTIVHLAAESHVDRSISGPDAFVDVNINGTHSMLKAARAVWLESSSGLKDGHRFHHVSTDEVYGSLGPDEPAFSETTAYAPNSPYAASKAASDHLVRAYHQTYGLKTSMSNCSNNYGPFQFPEKLIPLCIVNLLEGKELPIYGDGLNVRDWLHVADHCRGLRLILDQGSEGCTFNIGTDNEMTNIDLIRGLARMVDRMFGQDPALVERFPQAAAAQGRSSEDQIVFVKDRPGHDQRYAIDCGRIVRALGFRPEIGFDAGLEATVRWYIDNEAWWRAVMDESYLDWMESQYGTT